MFWWVKAVLFHKVQTHYYYQQSQDALAKEQCLCLPLWCYCKAASIQKKSIKWCERGLFHFRSCCDLLHTVRQLAVNKDFYNLVWPFPIRATTEEYYKEHRNSCLQSCYNIIKVPTLRLLGMLQCNYNYF